jgi:glycosyltransferase involved in cell wall biosynthesis
MKILFISEQFPYPLDSGGNIRTFNILKALALAHDVTLLTTVRERPPQPHIDAVRQLCTQMRLVRVSPNGPRSNLAALFRRVTGSLPLSMARHYRAAVSRELHDAFDTCGCAGAECERAHWRYDAVHFNHLDATVYLDDIPAGVLRVLDEHNVVVNQIQTSSRQERSWWRRAVLERDLVPLRAYEANACNAMHLCLTCSDVDAGALRELGVRGNLAVIPNGADLEYFRPAPSEAARECSGVFVGSMDYAPCDTGVFHFCTQLLPVIRQRMPSFRFVVVGRNPSKRLKRIASSDPGVLLTGRVEDVRPYVHAAGVFVVPLLSGSGTRLKILEAMAMAAPIVTTSFGVDGITAVHGKDLLIADAADNFADAVVDVLRNPQKSRALGTSARDTVEHLYGWDAVSRRLLEAYATTVNRAATIVAVAPSCAFKPARVEHETA